MAEQDDKNLQAIVLTTPNTVSLTLGIIGVVIGVFALLGGWIPDLGLAMIPSAIIGLLLSLTGIVFACFRKFKSIELPILGGLICVAAIGISIFSTYEARLKAEREANALAEQQRQQELQAELERQQLAAQQAQAKADQIVRLKSELLAEQEKLPSLQLAAEDSQSNLDAVQVQYDKFMSEKPYTTNVVYMKLKHELNQYELQRTANEQTIASLSGYYNGSYGNPVVGSSADAITGGPARRALAVQEQQYFQVAKQNVVILNQNIETVSEQLNDIVQTAEQFQENKLQNAQQAARTAQDELDTTRQRIENIKSAIR